MQDIDPDMRIGAAAVDVLQEASEAMLVSVLEGKIALRPPH